MLVTMVSQYTIQSIQTTRIHTRIYTRVTLHNASEIQIMLDLKGGVEIQGANLTLSIRYTQLDTLGFGNRARLPQQDICFVRRLT